MLVFPPVKVNLGLNITEKRKDGYHSIESVFFPVPWTDALEVVITDHQNLTFNATGLPIPGNQANNLVIKAFNLLSKEHILPGLNFHLHKILPMGAGLGGGSSNGAYALKLINEVCELGISMTELEKMAADLVNTATVERVGEGIKLYFNSQLLFDFGKADLKASNKADLQKFADILQEYPDTELLIIGHTDNVGSNAFNKTLSKKRAAAVSDYLASAGVNNNRLKAEGKGENEPAISNDTEENRSQNRRVEIAVYAGDKMKTGAKLETGK